MDKLKEMEARLWDYIDGNLSTPERSAIDKLIAEQAEWRSQYEELLQVHQLLRSSELEQPSMRFTRDVMDEIARYQIAPAARNYINNKIVWGIGVFFITMILGLVVYGLGQINWSEAADSKSTLGVDFDKLNYGKMFSNDFVNVFLMLNVVLGLMLLDRYLTSRKKKAMQQARRI
jgi:hypothetical protein